MATLSDPSDLMTQISRRIAYFSCTAFALLSLVACSAAPPPKDTATDADPDLALYRTVLDRVRASYVEPIRLCNEPRRNIYSGTCTRAGSVNCGRKAT